METPEIEGLAIAETIVYVRQQLKESLNERPHLSPTSFTLEVSFAATIEDKATGSIKIVVLTIGGGETSTLESSQKIVLNFSKPKAPGL
jgi:hypothetical protein